MKPNRPRRGRRPFRRPAPQKFRRPAERIPARLHVILAREAPKAVVFRKGPSNRVCTVGWDLEHDTFTPGQWLKTRNAYGIRKQRASEGNFKRSTCIFNVFHFGLPVRTDQRNPEKGIRRQRAF